MNIVDTLKDMAGPAIAQQAATVLGESEDGVSSALGTAIPTALGALLGKVNDPGALGGILEAFRSGTGGNLGDQLGGILGGADDSDEVKASKSVLDNLFGENLNGVIEMLSKATGLKVNSAGGILALVGSLLGKFFGGKATSEGLDTSGLADLLNSQKANILSALPAEAGSMLGLDLPKIAMPKVDVPKVAAPAVPVSETSIQPTQGSNWLVPAFGAIVVAGVIWWFTRPTPVSPTEVKPASSSSTQSEDSAKPGKADSNGPTKAGEPAQAIVTKVLPDGKKLTYKGGGIESQLVGFIEDAGRPVDTDTWFNFHGLNFGSSSATLKPGTYDEINNLASILKAFPKVRLKVGGYTDDTGDANVNLQLSQLRADAVMPALVEAGVQPERRESEGYGSDYPVADNNSEEGRAQNRRIAVRVTAK